MEDLRKEMREAWKVGLWRRMRTAAQLEQGVQERREGIKDRGPGGASLPVYRAPYRVHFAKHLYVSHVLRSRG